MPLTTQDLKDSSSLEKQFTSPPTSNITITSSAQDIDYGSKTSTLTEDSVDSMMLEKIRAMKQFAKAKFTTVPSTHSTPREQSPSSRDRYPPNPNSVLFSIDKRHSNTNSQSPSIDDDGSIIGNSFPETYQSLKHSYWYYTRLPGRYQQSSLMKKTTCDI